MEVYQVVIGMVVLERGSFLFELIMGNPIVNCR